MNLERELIDRSDARCELCGASEGLAPYEVPPHADGRAEHAILACTTCRAQLEEPSLADPSHWRCLNDSMWSPVPAVQVVAYRMLTRLRDEGWPQGLLDQLYLDDETLAWAQAGTADSAAEEQVRHVDCHGAVLETGDTVTLIKDLDVKGANFTAKRGTAVRGIALVADNSEQIEGRVNGQRIVLLTKFVKKSQ